MSLTIQEYTRLHQIEQLMAVRGWLKQHPAAYRQLLRAMHPDRLRHEFQEVFGGDNMPAHPDGTRERETLKPVLPGAGPFARAISGGS